MNGDPGSTWPLTRQIILVVILVATNGLFAAAEMAFVSLSQTKINELSSVGNKKAMRVMKLLEQSSLTHRGLAGLIIWLQINIDLLRKKHRVDI